MTAGLKMKSVRVHTVTVLSSDTYVEYIVQYVHSHKNLVLKIILNNAEAVQSPPRSYTKRIQCYSRLDKFHTKNMIHYSMSTKSCKIFDSGYAVCDAHRGDWLRGVRIESFLASGSYKRDKYKICWFTRPKILSPEFSNFQNFWNLWSNITAKSKPNSKILKPVYQGPG